MNSLKNMVIQITRKEENITSITTFSVKIVYNFGRNEIAPAEFLFTNASLIFQ